MVGSTAGAQVWGGKAQGSHQECEEGIETQVKDGDWAAKLHKGGPNT